jgi:5-methyltetrahydrofolate--homocysteine methyltransferase
MLLEQITKSLAYLDKEETISLTVQAILEGTTSNKIILQGLLPGLNEVAKRYEKNDNLYPDMYKASIIFQDALAKIKHQIVSMETKPGVRGAIGLVHGDRQDFGKNIVHMALETNGFVVKDLGKSVPKEEFLQVAQDGIDFIAISIMTDEGVEEAKKIVQTFKDAGVRDNVIIIVGGAGVSARKATEIIEADGYAENAEEAVEFLKIYYRAKKDM